jgi:hypothetical protein
LPLLPERFEGKMLKQASDEAMIYFWQLKKY